MTSSSSITFGPQLCGALAESATREWLVPDGLGGFAMGTVAGLRTRRYHGLLTVATQPPGGRRMALASLDPVLVFASGVSVALGVHEWSSGAVAPSGHQYLESFELVDGLPCWRWRVGEVVLERTIAMAHGTPAVGVVDRLVAGPAVRLELEALCTWRDVHGERFADGGLDMDAVDGGVVIEGAYRLRGPGWQPSGVWYRGVHARVEAERGLNADEDLWCAGRFSADLQPGQAAEVVAWAGALDVVPPTAAALVEQARTRAQALISAAKATDEVDATLVLAADSFVVTGPEVVAGYPWFGAWSRDTMTSYEGLFLETGRADEGRALLLRYAGTLSEGMLANTADTGSTEYNTADATLWFLHAINRHVARTGDLDLAAQLLDPLGGVIDAHVRGTRYNIGIDADGLLRQGEPGYALTWMDARVDGVGVTPRIGKPVELNALWISGLAGLRFLYEKIGRDAAKLAKLETRARTSFGARFIAASGWLYDVIDGPVGSGPDGADASMRPNQLLAFSLPDGPLRESSTANAGVVRKVAAALLTPIGLRSLAPGAPGYRGQHRGNPAQRDAAYHQGTVWPWLIGPYTEAALATAAAPGDDVRADVRADVRSALDGLVAHLGDWGLGSVSETADGDAPHAATGCPFQAWSVAELLRARRLLTR